jgi:rRNA maturation protein Nop10
MVEVGRKLVSFRQESLFSNCHACGAVVTAPPSFSGEDRYGEQRVRGFHGVIAGPPGNLDHSGTVLPSESR